MLRLSYYFETIAALFIACFLSVPVCTADIYQCDGQWTNKPCSEDSKPVKGLPKISKVRSFDYSTKTKEEERGSITVDSSGPSSPRASLKTPTCDANPDGVDVRLMGVNAVRKDGEDEEVIYLQGMVRNVDTEPVLDPIFVRVEAGEDLDEVQLHKITDSLLPGSSMRFSFEAARTPKGRHFGRGFGLTLLHENPRYCGRLYISSSDAVISNSEDPSDKKRFADFTGGGDEEQIIAELESTEDYIRELRKEYRPSERGPHNDEFNAQLSRTASHLNSICSRGSLHHSFYIRNKCTRLQRKLSRLR